MKTSYYWDECCGEPVYNDRYWVPNTIAQERQITSSGLVVTQFCVKCGKDTLSEGMRALVDDAYNFGELAQLGISRPNIKEIKK